MRAKFKLESVTATEYNEELKFSAVQGEKVSKEGYPADGSDEDNTFAKHTPCGSLELFVANPALRGKFKPGQKFYVDFTPAA